MTELQEARLLSRAITSRWDIPQETKSEVIDSLYKIATSGAEESARIAAARAIIAAEGQNQKDEHQEKDDFAARLIELARQYGIDASVIEALGIASRSAAGSDAKTIGHEGRRA